MKPTYSNVESLAKAAKELMLKEPFYGLLLLSLNKIWDNHTDHNGNPTLGVGLNRINYDLHINPLFWETLSPLHKQGVLKHELLHIGFFHLTDFTKYEDVETLNIAMDIEVNQYISEDMLPEGLCTLESFPELNLEPRKGTRYYYQKLREAKEQGNKNMQALSDAMQQNQSECTLPNGQSVNLPQHQWEPFENLDEATQKLLEQQTKHIVAQVADQVEKSRGTVPGEFAEILKRITYVEPPKFDWKGYIRRFVGKSIKTYTKKSRRKYNKRLPDFPGLRIKKQRRILAAVDTSGSVSTKELKEFLMELYHLSKTGSEVVLIQCDSAISQIGKFDPKQDVEIHGRGGTDFQPVIDYYNEHYSEFSCLIYFTDGEAPSPENAPGHILWVLSHQSTMNSDLPGQVIKLDL